MVKFIQTVRDFVYGEVERTGMPVKSHVDLSLNTGLELAKKLGANSEVVQAGTLLMDCMLGQAIKEGRTQEHIKMSLEKTNELLETSNLNEVMKENIRHCVMEHHGTDKFYSLEAEICCNADCYRFASIKGVTFAIRYLRDMPLNDLVSLLETKFKEKESALTLSVCRDELHPEIGLIRDWLDNLKS